MITLPNFSELICMPSFPTTVYFRT